VAKFHLGHTNLVQCDQTAGIFFLNFGRQMFLKYLKIQKIKENRLKNHKYRK
jgi:hypothetical protein